MKNLIRPLGFLTVASLALAAATTVTAQISLTAAAPTATQAFDKTDGKLFPATVLNWTDNGTYSGWYATANDRPATNYRTSNGGSTTFNPPILVLRTSGDNAALGVARGEHKGREVWGAIGACFKNDTGKPVTELRVSYTGQQWAQNTGGPDRLDVQFSTSAASLAQSGAGVWVDVPALAFKAPKSGAEKFGPINGMAAENSKKIVGTIKPAAPIAPGETFWLRWVDFKAEGGNQVLGIDDFSLTAVTE